MASGQLLVRLDSQRSCHLDLVELDMEGRVYLYRILARGGFSPFGINSCFTLHERRDWTETVVVVSGDDNGSDRLLENNENNGSD